MQKHTSPHLQLCHTLDTQPSATRQAPISDLLHQLHTSLSTPIDTQAPVTQRAVNPSSSPKLKTIYDALLANNVFAKLDTLVSPPTNTLTLVESTTIPTQAVYNASTHSIEVNITGLSDEAIGSYIMWEMHNAKSKSMLDEAHADITHGLGSTVLSPTVKTNTDLYLACYALSTEWIEWTKILEHVIRADAMNKSGRILVENIYKPLFTGGNPADPFAYGTGWFLFENYLKDQIKWGHTRNYDPSAIDSNPGWKGYFLLDKAHMQSPQLFHIPEAQVRKFLISPAHLMGTEKNIFTTQFLQELQRKYSINPVFK